MTRTKALAFLLIANNYQTLTAVADGLGQVGASFDFASTSEAGGEYVGRRKVDGIIVDLDVPGAEDLIRSIRQGTSNRGAVVFACLPSDNRSPVAVVTGATFLLPRPLTPESVASQVSAARSSMLREHRRFFRYPLSLPVYLVSNGAEQRGMMANLSEGGMAIYTVRSAEYRSMIEFAFELPSGEKIAGKGSVAWVNNEGMLGIEFHVLRGQGEVVLQKWIQEQQTIDLCPNNRERTPRTEPA